MVDDLTVVSGHCCVGKQMGKGQAPIRIDFIESEVAALHRRPQGERTVTCGGLKSQVA